MLLILTVIFVALAFEYINGFHDTANAIATSVSTRVMTPRQAIALSTVFNLLGALAGTAVAKTIGQGLVDTNFITLYTIMCALLSGIIWNLFTWWIGLPSSSSHALIGGLCGAALASANGRWSVLHWNIYDAAKGQWGGLWPKVVAPMIAAPTIGILGGFVVMGILLLTLRSARPWIVNRIFGKAQLVSAAWMSFSHGTNDAQKTMGIIALTLFTATTKTDTFNDLPNWLDFLHAPTFHIPVWVKVTCAITMAAGTAAGGWKIIQTMGRNLVKMQPVHGFAAQTTAAAIIESATHWGIPLSTTHVISGSIMGVGASKRLTAVKWSVVGRMLSAWILTLPITAGLAYVLLRGLQAMGIA
jgi:inorganic phosphate transporter, PiT family